MNKRILIWIIVCLNGVEYAQAQWTKQDSLWLQNILSGKEKLKLNEETLKAIESGSLINSDPKPSGTMRMAPKSDLPISKDFSNYIQRNDTTHRKVALKDLPPQVFWRYNPPIKIKAVSAFENIPIYHFASAMATFSLADLTSHKKHVHDRNVKRDGTWKEYDNLPTPDVISKHRAYLNQHPEADIHPQTSLQTQTVKKDTTNIKDNSAFTKNDTLFAKTDSLLAKKKAILTPRDSVSSKKRASFIKKNLLLNK
jgi:hypothetical protein